MDKKTKAVKPKADPTKKLLIAAIKKTINHNTVLPILEDVYLSGDEVIFTDLENVVIFPFKAEGINACVPANKFIDVLEMMEAPTFAQDKNFKVTMTEGKRSVKMSGEDPNNFPKTPEVGKPIGNWTALELGYLKDVLDFCSNDDLRPAMTGVFCSDQIVATDAHRLAWFPITKLKQEILLPAKAVKILLGLGGEKWEIMGTDHHATFINEHGVTLITRIIDARFPDYKVVIPANKGLALTMEVDKDEILKELKNALKFANTLTHMVSFHLNGKIVVSSQDVDFEFGYSNELEGNLKVRVKEGQQPEPLTISFNGNFLSEIIQKTKDHKVSIKVWGPTKAAIVNENYLLMPLMLNQ